MYPPTTPTGNPTAPPAAPPTTAGPAETGSGSASRFRHVLGLRSMVRRIARARAEARQLHAVTSCVTPSERRDLLTAMGRHTAGEALPGHEERMRLLLLSETS